jgi:PBSX family phage terminase large subunit
VSVFQGRGGIVGLPNRPQKNISGDDLFTHGEVAPLSQKGINSIANTGYLNVWEGAVRSGKTVASSIAWILYVSMNPGTTFIMSGKTQASLFRNVIAGEYGMLAMLGPMGEYRTDKEGNRIFAIKTSAGIKTCYCFGANDERSYQTLRGLTAEGWYADEINLHPRSFIEEAFRRTIVSHDRRHYWTLNPDNPNHFIYTDFTDKYEEEELAGFHIWHFTLEDNFAISDERKEELKRQYKGVFYRRYILGERVMAEGVIYDMFSEDNIFDPDERPMNLELIAVRSIACDYGTTNPCVFLDIWDDGQTIWVDREYRWDSKREQVQKTDYQYADDMVQFQGERFAEIVIDPSAASFKAELRNRGIYVIDADNEVMDGIRAVSSMLARGQIKIARSCKGLILEMRSYLWNEKLDGNGKERPLKEGDHGPDALRYFVKTKMPAWRVGLNDETE